jgi:hypothetical protein
MWITPRGIANRVDLGFRQARCQSSLEFNPSRTAVCITELSISTADPGKRLIQSNTRPMLIAEIAEIRSDL